MNKTTSLDRICAILANESGLAALLDEMPLGVAVLDKDGRIGLVNRAYESLTGVYRQDAAGLDCMHSLRCNFCVQGCPVRERDEGFSPISRDADIINRDRKKIRIRLTLARITDSGGSPAGFVETVQEIGPGGLDQAEDSRAYSLGGLVGKSEKIEKIFRMIPSVAQTDSSVLITGETGTGKDMLAEAIHKSSERARGPFIKVNCGALPDTLLESELFGHSKGAFTGADRGKPGRFRLAHGGTLFLTEIGDLPLPLQVKLLSFLDDKIIHPLGGDVGFHADVRVIFATHRDLEEMVRKKIFRQDLLFRLNVIRLHLPPLRERDSDVGLLKGHFLAEFCAKFNKDIQGFSDRARDLLINYSYPGNVRELRNIVEYAVNFCDEKIIRLRHLPAYLTDGTAVMLDGPREAEKPSAPAAAALTPDSAAALADDSDWESTERRMIMEALVRAGGRKGKAAEILGWGRSTMWRKLKHYGITK